MGKFIRRLWKHPWAATAITTIVAATVAGIAEYVMTDGLSGLAPLWAGILGAAVGVLISLFLQMAEPTQDADKVFVQKTSRELVKELKGRTTASAKPVIQRYAGIWMWAHGEIFDIIDESEEDIVVLVSGTDLSPGFTLQFNKDEWGERLNLFDRYDMIHAEGIIVNISETIISLKDCSLVRTEDDSPMRRLHSGGQK